MNTRTINVFILIHRYKAMFNAVNIYDNRDKLIQDLKNDIDKYTSNKENLDKDLQLDYITYPDVVYDNDHMIVNELVDPIIKVNINHWLVIDGLDIVKIKDHNTMLNNYDNLYKISHDATMSRGTDLDSIREKFVSDLCTPNITSFERAKLIAVIGNTYDLTESSIDDNKEDLSDKIVKNIIEIRSEYENTDDPENEWELVNNTVDRLLECCNIKNLEVKKCTYNGQPIEYNDIVRKLLSHVFPNYLTQVNILDTLDDNYIIETDKCKIIRSIGGSLRVELNHDKE